MDLVDEVDEVDLVAAPEDARSGRKRKESVMSGEYLSERENAERLWRMCVGCARHFAGLPVGVSEGRPAGMPRHEMPALQGTPANVLAVAELLFGTLAQESALRWERQRSPVWDGEVGGFGKAQLEVASIHRSLEDMRKAGERGRKLLRLMTEWVFNDPKAPVSWVWTMPFEAVLWALRMDDNDKIGLGFCRLHYLRVPEAVPLTLEGQAGYWKQYYNTVEGKGTVEEYVGNLRRLCGEVVRSQESGDRRREPEWGNGNGRGERNHREHGDTGTAGEEEEPRMDADEHR